MIKAIILSTLLVASTLATLSSVNIQKVDIEENIFVSSKNKMTGVPLADLDSIYPASVRINNQNTPALFDTTVGENWKYQSEATPVVDGQETLATSEGRSTLIKGTKFEIDEVVVDGQHLKNVNVIKSNTLQGDSNTEITKKVKYGFGLDKSYQTNFFATLRDNGVRLQKEGFSFQISSKINQIMFGAPQQFFASNSLEIVPTQSTSKLWRVQVNKNSLALKDLNQLSYNTPQFAVFDSTTRYIWAEDQLVDSIVAQLNSKGLNCQDVNTAAPVGVYNCDDDEFPALFIAFNGVKGVATKPFLIKKYTDSIGNGQVRLLIRKAANYNKQQSQNVPNLTPSKTDYDLVLGTIFFENVYTYFNVESGNVELSQAFVSEPQSHGIASGARLWYLILGGVLLLAALVALLALIKEVPFKPAAQPGTSVRTIPHQVVPGQSYVQQSQSPVLLQSYVRPLNSIPAGQTYYVQQNPVQVSPTRVYQTQYVPK
ncbi:Aspartic peptidase domain [Pseudocohnilembus persalinus]|uniref:Aspartic peptidase domain n=1 Tax=Pseudocohnilembus persalinus TaxID=266149 RepID=A0A0V0R199_PSEPJ|nr:Aspartic peptidase domain [Pseudocohnilembus persalinus]|eukprot:KRX08058.1 Aspartic peptidase domain [Pseudocohnilembus persalinus]